MARIKAEMPVLPVPLVARALLRADGPLSRDALRLAVGRMLDGMSRAELYLPQGDPEHAVRCGVEILRDRGLIEERSGTLSPVESERPVLTYYAASIAHLFHGRSGA